MAEVLVLDKAGVDVEIGDLAVTKQLHTAKGDLVVATGSNVVAVLPVGGSDGDVLTVDSSADTGLSYQAPSGGGGGTVDSVTAGDATITVGGTASDPTVEVTAGTFATAAQGATADTAVQPGDLATVATTGVYNDLTGKPSGLHAAPWRFYVEDYGAVGDGTTDDSAAIIACISAAVTYASSHQGYCEVWFQDKYYLCNAATTKGGATLGNAIIPIPVVSSSNLKVTLALRGASSSAYSHWDQTVPQKTGTVIFTTNAAPASDGTWGDPSIIGGPGPNYNGGHDSNDKFSNMFVDVNGVSISAPYNPGWVGWDMAQMAEARFERCAAIANIAIVAGPPNLGTLPTNSNGIAFRMPKQSNNDISWLDDVTVEGWYYAWSVSEHFNAGRIGALYVVQALYINVSGTAVHGASIRYMGCEYFKEAIHVDGTLGSSSYPISIGLLDCEQLKSGGAHINDGRSALYGEIGWSDYQVTDPTVIFNTTGSTPGPNVVLKNRRRHPGNVTAPTVPASGTAYTSTIYAPSGAIAVSVHGGTVTDIAIDGASTGLTSGTVIIPNGRTITLTYSAAPSWTWTLL